MKRTQVSTTQVSRTIIFSLIILISVSLFAGFKDIGATIILKKKVGLRQPVSSIKETKSVCTRITAMVYKGLLKANDFVDYVLTSKGAIKMAVMLSPFVYWYCMHYGIDPVQDVINKIIQSIGEAQANYEIQLEIGKSTQFWNNLYNNPFSAMITFGSKLFNKAIYVGIPFIAGVLFKVGMGAK